LLGEVGDDGFGLLQIALDFRDRGGFGLEGAKAFKGAGTSERRGQRQGFCDAFFGPSGEQELVLRVTAERRASEAMLKKQAKGSKRITVGEDKAYGTSDHIAALHRINVTPHVAQNDSLTKTGKRRRSAIDARTTRHIGYQISQTCRKMAECIFGWSKQHGTMRKTKHRGIAAVAADFMLNLIAYNLVRIPKLIAA